MSQIRILAHTVEPVHNFYRQQFGIRGNNFEYIHSFDSSNKLNKNNEITNFSFKSMRRMFLTKINPFDTLKIPVVKPIQSDCDLVHMAQLIPLTDKPWVVDFEEVSVFANYDFRTMQWPQYKWLFKNYFLNDKCKQILPWTNAAKESLEYYISKANLDKEILKKVEVVYPFVDAKNVKKKNNSVQKILFIGKEFYLKGGIDAIESFILLSKRIDCELTIISRIPLEVMARYSKVKGLNLVQSGPNVSDEFIKKCYENADLFIFPSHLDTLGFVVMEAMSYGLPVVGVNQFALPELVTKNGILVDNYYSIHENFVMDPLYKTHPNYHLIFDPKKEYLNKLADACESILSSSSLKNKMSAYSLKEVVSGKFSKQRKIDALERIYLRAVE
jgi:glycosyltransferase involved in cell wall biosynthesis